MGLIRARAEDWRLAAEVVESDKVRWVVGSFKSYKSADSDFIFPILFQEELDLIIGRLTRILRACLALTILSRIWKLVRIVFILKEKASYILANNFRPISLTSYLLRQWKS